MSDGLSGRRARYVVIWVMQQVNLEGGGMSHREQKGTVMGHCISVIIAFPGRGGAWFGVFFNEQSQFERVRQKP